jgi:hypothetical protein
VELELAAFDEKFALVELGVRQHNPHDHELVVLVEGEAGRDHGDSPAIHVRPFFECFGTIFRDK